MYDVTYFRRVIIARRVCMVINTFLLAVVNTEIVLRNNEYIIYYYV